MVTFDEAGLCEFRVFIAGAHRVQLAGDFTDWSEGALDLMPVGDGWWSVEVRLPQGDRVFQYLVDNHRWMADYAAHGVQVNDFGLWESLLHVEAPPPKTLSFPEQVAEKAAA